MEHWTKINLMGTFLRGEGNFKQNVQITTFHSKSRFDPFQMSSVILSFLCIKKFLI